MDKVQKARQGRDSQSDWKAKSILTCGIGEVMGSCRSETGDYGKRRRGVELEKMPVMSLSVLAEAQLLPPAGSYNVP